MITPMQRQNNSLWRTGFIIKPMQRQHNSLWRNGFIITPMQRQHNSLWRTDFIITPMQRQHNSLWRTDFKITLMQRKHNSLWRTVFKIPSPWRIFSLCDQRLCNLFRMSILAGLCAYTANGIVTEFTQHNLTVGQTIAYPVGTVLTDSFILNQLQFMKRTSRGKCSSMHSSAKL